MCNRREFRGVSASSHVDKHGERLTLDDLKKIKSQYDSQKPFMIFWAHQTTLLPTGIIANSWIEKTPDGEYRLNVEGFFYAANDNAIIPLPESNLQGLDFTVDQLQIILKKHSPSLDDYLTLHYDPQNFEESDINAALAELNKLISVHARRYTRKAEISDSAIWILIVSAAGQIIGGFLGKLGEIAADKMMEQLKKSYRLLSKNLLELSRKSKPNTPSDFILGIQVPDSITHVEGAVEHADEKSLQKALETTSFLYAIAIHLIANNRPNFFSRMTFLFNPETSTWEINYLVTHGGQIIKGPRYYDESHPLHQRYKAMQQEIEAAGYESIGMSFGGVIAPPSKDS